ncbi:MAG TPA: DUF3788 family protein [Bacteroidales bacterium]|nr:DUF3788 family protein [Bacteroidales bacterium]
MALSIFEDKFVKPTEKMLTEALQDNILWWKEIKDFVIQQYPLAIEEWKHSGNNYGWGFRLKDKKRAIVYLTPADKYFLFSIVFGEKASQDALQSDISEEIKQMIRDARVYAEGRGIQIRVNSDILWDDIKKLILIKLKKIS